MKIAVLALSASAALAAPASAQVIFNETFESGTGVFTASGNVGVANGAIYNPCCNTPVDTSNNFAAFGDGNEGSGILSTTFATTTGSSYNVSFDFAALGSGTDPLTFNVAGQSFVFNPVANNNIVFTPGMFTFAAAGAQTTLSIFSGGVANVDAILDNVSVSAVPEAETWAMMIFGFGAVGFAMRRRKQLKTVTA